jgi:hypothetical protein
MSRAYLGGILRPSARPPIVGRQQLPESVYAALDRHLRPWFRSAEDGGTAQGGVSDQRIRVDNPGHLAGLIERLLLKQDVAGSIPVSRSSPD